MTVAELLTRWTADASTLRSWGAEAEARVVERCAEELAEALGTHDDEAVTLGEAAAASGYSVAHLRRLVARGVLDDVGSDGVTALRQQDLPLKPGRQRHPRPLGVLSSPI